MSKIMSVLYLLRLLTSFAVWSYSAPHRMHHGEGRIGCGAVTEWC
jgi:hypothetical protein